MTRWYPLDNAAGLLLCGFYLHIPVCLCHFISMGLDRAKQGNALDLPPLHSLVFDFGVGLIAKRIHVARRGGLLVLGVLLPSRLRVCRSREWVHAVDAHFGRYNEVADGSQDRRCRQSRYMSPEPVGEKFSRVASATGGTRGSKPRESSIAGRWIRWTQTGIQSRCEEEKFKPCWGHRIPTARNTRESPSFGAGILSNKNGQSSTGSNRNFGTR